MPWREVFDEQEGVAGLDQLTTSKAARCQLAAAIAEGRLERRGRWLIVDTAWSATGPQSKWRRRLFLILCSCSPRYRAGLTVYRRTAAYLWGFDGAAPAVVELAGPQARPPGTHRVRLPPGDIASVGGLAVTTVTRTLIDICEVVSPDIVERSLEWALRKGQTSTQGLSDALAAAPNRRGTRALRQLVGDRGPTAPATESDAETLFLQLARRAGLPAPVRQFLVPTSEGTFRLDFAWPSHRLAVEVDGASTHASREALTRDLRRQNRLMLCLAAAGWSLLRFTWDDVADERYASQVAATVREAWVIGVNRVV